MKGRKKTTKRSVKRPVHRRVLERTVRERTAELEMANQALRAERDKAQSYLDIARVVLVAIDADQRVTLINRKGCELLGYPQEDILGKNWFDAFLPERVRAETRSAFEKLVSGTLTPAEYYENPVRTRDGRERIIAWHNSLMKDAEGHVVGTLSSGEDITERKRAEMELQDRAVLAQFQAAVGEALAGPGDLRSLLQRCAQSLVDAFDGAFARIWTLNAAEQVLELQASAGIYTHLNGTHSRVPLGGLKIGRIAQERKPHLTNRVIGDPLVKEQEWARREGMVAFAGFPLLVEERVVGVMAMFARHPLTERDLQAMASVSHTIAMAIERKRAEEALRQSEAKHKALIETTDTGYVIVDNQGRVVDANGEYVRLTGHEWLEEILGRSVVEWTAKHDQERNAAEVRKCAERGFVRNLEIDYVNKDGQFTPIELNATVVKTPTTAMILSVCRDITARKRAEEALRESEARSRAILSAMPDLMFVLDQNGVFVDYQAAIPSRLCVPPEKFLGKRADEVLPPDVSRQLLAARSLVAQTAQMSHFEYSLDMPDGKCEFEARVVGLGDNRIMCIVRDITARRRAEEALRHSEEVHRASIEAIGAVPYSRDFRTDRYEFVGTGIERLIGYPPNECVSGLFENIVQEVVMPGVGTFRTLPEAMRAFSATEATVWVADYRVRTRDGRECWLTDAAVNERDDSGRIVRSVGMVFDITARKNAEAALRESESKYRSLHESMRDAFVSVDMSGRIREFNAAYRAMLGYSAEELLQRTYEDVTPEKWHAFQRRIIAEQVLTHGHSDVFQKEYQRKDGTVFPVELRATLIRGALGQPAAMWAIVRDITERKRAEEALRQFKFMVEEADEEVYLANPDGSFAYVNKAAANSLGYTVEELMRLGVPGIDPHYGPDYAAAFEETKAGQLPLVETLHVTKDGRRLHKEIKTSILQIGERDYIVGFGRDVTQRKRAEEALAANERRFRLLAEENARLLEQARRDTETKATLLQEVNHRVKNNLASIMGLLHAQQRFGRGKGSASSVRIASDLANRIEGLSIVHQMLSSTSWASLQLSELVAEVTRFSLQSVPHDKHVAVEVSSSPITVTADQASSLAFVLNELATNTVKHALKDRPTARITVSLAEEGGNVRLTFQDDGPGYPKAALQFKHRTAGMYLVENIVKNSLRGTLKLSNAPGAVTDITFKHSP